MENGVDIYLINQFFQVVSDVNEETRTKRRPVIKAKDIRSTITNKGKELHSSKNSKLSPGDNEEDLRELPLQCFVAMMRNDW